MASPGAGRRQNPRPKDVAIPHMLAISTQALTHHFCRRRKTTSLAGLGSVSRFLGGKVRRLRQRLVKERVLRGSVIQAHHHGRRRMADLHRGSVIRFLQTAFLENSTSAARASEGNDGQMTNIGNAWISATAPTSWARHHLMRRRSTTRPLCALTAISNLPEPRRAR